MKKLALFSSVILSLAFSFSPDVAVADFGDVKSQLLTQSQQEPQSPEAFIDSINLTEEQQAQIQAILAEYRPEVRATFQELLEARQELKDTIAPTRVSARKMKL